VQTGKPAEALRDLERAIALGGDNPGAAHCARGMAQQALGDIDAALASYEAAVEHDPTNVAAWLRLFQFHAEREEWDKCQAAAAAMLARSPDDTSLLLAHARVCHRNHQREDALSAYDRLIALEPKNAVAYRERSGLQQGRGDTLAARADMARAFELAPDDLEIRATHGCNRVQGAETDEDRAAGLALIASSAELDAQNPEAWARAASCFYRTAQGKADAVRFITRAIELAPDVPEYLSSRAVYIQSARPWQRDDPEGFEEGTRRALADVEHALELCADEDLELQLYSDRAGLREELGDLEGAIADHTHLIEVDPESIDGWMERARLRKRIGDMEGARADAARVREMEDDHPDVAIIKRFNLDDER
jgi:tetratricopeptide (TPR) repeat protein